MIPLTRDRWTPTSKNVNPRTRTSKSDAITKSNIGNHPLGSGRSLPASHHDHSPGPIPIFQKIGQFSVSPGYKIGEIKSYYHNYELSMEIKHQADLNGYSLQGKLTKTISEKFSSRKPFLNYKSWI